MCGGEFIYGQRVKITHKLKRRIKTIKTKNSYGTVFDRDYKYWSPAEFDSAGIFLGYRTLSNGLRDYDLECGHTFKGDDFFKAALVSPGPNLNPIYVPLDAITQKDAN